ncbi:MAG: mannosyl-glycoprotein endo-beta-N-acetylglucosamidase [Burkholderiaceae bacterium]|nr:mannosyl-glycoprotein endo-beta-N-acetylglucosamidase [Burkholderiaceae bacterium]
MNTSSAKPGPREAFLESILPPARQAAETLGVSTKAALAQAALETGWGRAVPRAADGRSSHNLFGIKADSRWRGETLTLDTKEFLKGQWVVVPAKWRKYPSWQASIDDHATFLKSNPRYSPCFQCSTPEAFARALAKAGYATDPIYADKVISVMTKHNLTTFDGGIL